MNNGRVLVDMMAFVEVAQQQSYTKAANNLGISKAAVSQQIKRLEVELDEQLLIRNTRGMTLTAQGLALLRRCEVIREQFDLAKKELELSKEEPSGRFAITCPISCEKNIIIPALSRLCIEYPKLEPLVLATDEVKDLIQDDLDVAVFIGDLKNSYYRALEIGGARERFYASPDYLMSYGKPQSTCDIDKHKWIVMPWQEKGIVMESSEEQGGKIERKLPASVYSNNLFGALEMLKAGMGAAFLPSIVANQAIEQGELSQILTDYQGRVHKYYFIHRYPSNKPAHIERFYQLLKYYFGGLI